MVEIYCNRTHNNYPNSTSHIPLRDTPGISSLSLLHSLDTVPVIFKSLSPLRLLGAEVALVIFTVLDGSCSSESLSLTETVFEASLDFFLELLLISESLLSLIAVGFFSGVNFFLGVLFIPELFSKSSNVDTGVEGDTGMKLEVLYFDGVNRTDRRGFLTSLLVPRLFK